MFYSLFLFYINNKNFVKKVGDKKINYEILPDSKIFVISEIIWEIFYIIL